MRIPLAGLPSDRRPSTTASVAVAPLVLLLAGCWQSHAGVGDEDRAPADAGVDDAADDGAAEDAGVDDGRVDVPPDASADDAAEPDADFGDTTTNWDLGPPADAVDYEAEAFPPVETSPLCGNGVLDPGEECDDRNRLDGDGCDWRCRFGDGDPPPPPDPDAPVYVPVGEPTVVLETEIDAWSFVGLPVAWTGSHYATVVYAHDDGGTSQLRFIRFDAAGARVGAEWRYGAPGRCHGTDLVWHGSGFGLFFSDADRGIFFVELDPEGKPRGPPVLVEPDPQARAPSADLTADGYVLAWVHEGSDDGGWSLCGGWYEPPDSARVRRVGRDGATAGEPVIVEGFSGGTAHIATGEDGFGLTLWMNSSPAWPSCALRFVHLSDDFSRITASGYLSNGVEADVAWSDGRYVTAWSHYDTMAGGDSAVCVARFDAAGTLEHAPTCNRVPEVDASAASGGIGSARLAAGDRGLAVVANAASDTLLFFLRTDVRGAAVAAPTFIASDPASARRGPSFGRFGTTWADTGFGVAFTVRMGGPDRIPIGLYFLSFEAE